MKKIIFILIITLISTTVFAAKKAVVKSNLKTIERYINTEMLKVSSFFNVLSQSSLI